MIPGIEITKQRINAPSRRIKARWTFNSGPPVTQLDETTFQLDIIDLEADLAPICDFLARHPHDSEQDSDLDVFLRIQFHDKKSAMEFKLRFIK